METKFDMTLKTQIEVQWPLAVRGDWLAYYAHLNRMSGNYPPPGSQVKPHQVPATPSSGGNALAAPQKILTVTKENNVWIQAEGPHFRLVNLQNMGSITVQYHGMHKHEVIAECNSGGSYLLKTCTCEKDAEDYVKDLYSQLS